MATIAPPAASMGLPWRQRGWSTGEAIERWLEAERDQLPLWLPVALGGGITAWFLLPDPHAWITALLAMLALACGAVAVGRHQRWCRAVAIGGLAAALGLVLVWWRAERVAAPVLGGPAIAVFTADVELVEPLAARELVRLTLLPRGGAADDRGQAVTLPTRIRVNVQQADMPAGVAAGAVVRLRARLMPPPGAGVPGAYDYARQAWFDQVGGTGRGFAPVTVITAVRGEGGLRAGLTAHIAAHLPGSAGGIAAALATGDMGAITQNDSDAMRKAGLAHLLSVSGLHITAAVAATMFVVLRLLALVPWLALRVRLPLLAALAGAAAAIGYTALTGWQVPTIRSCVAGLLVLGALAMGRQAVTLRLVATGAIVVMLFRPEALAGPSFQLSFAAIAAIISLHEHPRVAGWFGQQDEPRWRKWTREGGSLLVTGLVVELALMPISVYHFHRAGFYGALANIVAIPLTTFVVMPLEALALLFDIGGVGAPFWWLTGKSLAALLWLAHVVADAPGAVTALPSMPDGAFALMAGGGLWIALWRTRWRRLGAVPLTAGLAWALATPAPDLLVTGDGRHLAVRTPDGGLALLRDRAGDYTQTMLAASGGAIGELPLLDEQANARCSDDLCLTAVTSGGRRWRVLATRSGYPLETAALLEQCRSADIVVSDRRLPRGCTPRWLRLDPAVLRKTGGVAIALGAGRIETVRQPGDRHPWSVARRLFVPRSPEWDQRRHGRRDNDRSGRPSGESKRLVMPPA